MIQALTNRLLDFTPKNPDESLPQAAVLILCYEKDNDLYFVMTERSNSLPSHPGEVAFPGGYDLTVSSPAFKECKLIVIPGEYDFVPTGIAYQKYSPYADAFDYYIERMRASGIIRRIREKYSQTEQMCPTLR